MAWTQVYTPIADSVGLSALCAAIPLFILFYMLAVKQAKGHVAALLGLAGALVVAIFLWGMPVGLAVSSTLNGAAFGLFPIVWIIITAVWIYNMTVESGEFEIIKYSLSSVTNDRRLQALFIAFAFSCFIEGTAGFGTPAAIAAAMLMGLGFKPLWAGGIALIANTAPVAFGAIGVPIIVAAQVSNLDVVQVSSIAGRQLSLLAIIVPLWVCVVMCGFKRSMEVLPAILVSGVSFAAAQFLLSNLHGPTLCDVASAAASIVSLIALLKVWKPKNVFVFEGEEVAEVEASKYTGGQILKAWAAYLILAVFVFFWGLGFWKSMLNSIPGAAISFPWPGLHGEVLKTAPIAADMHIGFVNPRTVIRSLLSAEINIRIQIETIGQVGDPSMGSPHLPLISCFSCLSSSMIHSHVSGSRIFALTRVIPRGVAFTYHLPEMVICIVR